ncbi:Trafficking protein particle complex subunit, partial [Thalictrum thalictroides]
MSCNSDVNIKKLAHLTTGYTGADISLICREAALAAMEESLEASEVSMAHFESGLGRVQPSEVRGDEDFYSMFQRHKEEAAHQHQFILHAALDIVQDLAWTTSAMFLKAVDRFNDLVVSVYVTA